MYLSCFYKVESTPYEVPALRLFMATWLIIVSLSSSILNSLVIWSIWKTATLHKPSYVLLANLAWSDFLNSLINAPLMAYVNIASARNELHCNVFILSKAMTYLTSAVIIGTLAGISLDRLLAVTLKTAYQTKVTAKRVAASLLMYWMAPFITCFAFIDGFHLEGVKHFLFLSGVGTLLYLIQIGVSYGLAYFRLRKRTTTVKPIINSGEDPMDEHIKKYRKTTNKMVILCIAILLSYVPFLFASINVLSGCKNDDGRCFLFLEISEVVVASNSIMNPVMYLWQMRELRETVKTRANVIFHL